GGGSIARVDAGGILHVGPESAGADPGPACYGNGGSAATVTDANLVLGYLGPASFLGGRRLLDRAAAEMVVDDIAAALGVDRLSASPGSGGGAGFDGPVRSARSVDMRYGEQVFEIAVPLNEVDWAKADPLPDIVERFHRRHEELYTYCLPDQETVLVNARVALSGVLAALPQEPALPEAPPVAPRSERRIYLDDWFTAPVYDFDTLAPGQTI